MIISIHCPKLSNGFLIHKCVQFKILMEPSMVLRTLALDLISCLSAFLSRWPSHTGFLGIPPIDQARSCPEAFVRAVPSAKNVLSPYPLPHIASLCCLLAKLLTYLMSFCDFFPIFFHCPFTLQSILYLLPPA